MKAAEKSERLAFIEKPKAYLNIGLISRVLAGSQLLMAAVAVVFACVAESVALSRSSISERTTQRIRCYNVVAQSVLLGSTAIR